MYNVSIIGCGNKGALADAPGTGNEHKYLSYAHAVKDHEGFELASFRDVDKGAQEQAERIWGKGNGNASDIVIIATPDHAHYRNLMWVTNPKLVICEKPLCTDLKQAREVVDVYKAAGIPLMVDYTRRFIPDYQQMQDEIISGKWGKFIEGYGYFNRGWLHTASHMVDFVLWMNGNLDNFKIKEIKTDTRWIYQIGMFYENDFFSDHAVNFVKNPHVPSMYDNHLMYVMDNAWYFLEGADKLLCTGEDALRALEETERIRRYKSMIVALIGANGFIGKIITEALEDCGIGVMDVRTDVDYGLMQKFDCLIHCARHHEYITPPITPEKWAQEYNTDVILPWHFTELMVKHMPTLTNIIIVTSVYGRIPPTVRWIPENYCMAKAAEHFMIKMMAVKYAPKIRVNGLELGGVESDREVAEQSEEFRKKYSAKTLVGQMVQPYQVADKIKFLVMNSEGMTGECIPLTGGYGLV